MKNYIKLMRPKHYLKNILIFLPLVFSGKLLEGQSLLNGIYAFISFSLAASVVYIINDIRDKEKDALHEVKKSRPIASGKVSIKNAIILTIFLLIISYLFNCLATFSLLDLRYLFIIVYIILNVFYSFGLKNIPLLDIVILVSGFLIRVLYGANVIEVEISNWLYLTIMAISFYLGLGKRRNEIIKSGSKSREVLKYYNREF